MILKSLAALSGVCLFGLSLLGALLSLLSPLHAIILIGFSLWAILYSTAHIDC